MTLIAVFVLQTLIVPLALQACLYAGIRTLLAAPLRRPQGSALRE